MKVYLRILLMTAGFTVGSILMLAEEPKAPVTPPPAAKAPEQPATVAPSAEDAFALGRLSAQMEELQTQYSKMVQRMVSQHPGYLWDPSHNVLVLQPRPAAPAAHKEGK